MLTYEKFEFLKRLARRADVEYVLEKIVRARTVPYRSPLKTLAVVEKLFEFEGVPVFNPSIHAREIPIIWLNCELLDAVKGRKLDKVFANIMARAGLMAMAEADEDGVLPVAESCGYDFFSATPNTRGQACVIAWHRQLFQLVSKGEHWETTNIGGIPGLRPSAEVVLCHKPSGVTMRFLASHFKSLRGGWWLTCDVRFDQATKLLKTINQSPVLPTIAPGDYNCFLESLRVYGSKDVDPFVTEDWSLLGGRDDKQPTQALGGRLDGIFFKWFLNGMSLSNYKIIPLYAEAPEVTDHAALIGTLNLY